jgi:ABC-2 type transport system permease protein
MPLHNVNYKHWQGEHLGLWHRRWAIARNGLVACLQIRWMVNFVVLSWSMALAASIFLFELGQLLVPDSMAVRWASKLNPLFQNFVNNLTEWLAGHPEISVGVTQNVFFYFFCHYLTIISIFLLGIALPCFFTRDLASNAIVIYSSKAVSRGDYLLGRFASVFGFLCLTWLGPACAAWFVGNLLAPNWTFFWHARLALENILVSGLSGILILSVLALGVSASGVKEMLAVAFWFTWWILGVFLAPIAIHTEPWLRHLSFSFDINEIGLATFRVTENITTARASVPTLGPVLQSVPASTFAALATPNLAGTWVALGAMVAVAVWLIYKRIKPE